MQHGRVYTRYYAGPQVGCRIMAQPYAHSPVVVCYWQLAVMSHYLPAQIGDGIVIMKPYFLLESLKQDLDLDACELTDTRHAGAREDRYRDRFQRV